MKRHAILFGSPCKPGWCAASALLAVLVIGVFVALILALAALQRATKEEARSKEVTASALMLEKLVLDVDAGVRGFVITGGTPSFSRGRTSRQE